MFSPVISSISATDCQITIVKAANGFIVTMPLKRPSEAENLMKQASSMLKNFRPGGDDVMDKIREMQETEETENDDQKAYILPNVHVFATWKEVISFLKLQVD